MKPYVIKQGDHLAKLAFSMGFDATAIWSDDANADLKAKRTTGDVLLPGDILYVPDDPGQKLPYTVETVNKYQTSVPKVKVEIVLAGPDGKPIEGEPFVVKGLGDEAQKTTAKDGKVTFEASILTKQVEVHLTNREQKLHVVVGGLDPANEPSGARMRLEHLGLYAPTFSGGKAPYATSDEDQLSAALAAFQAAKNLVTSGKLDASTIEALVAAHGS